VTSELFSKEKASFFYIDFEANSNPKEVKEGVAAV